MTAVHFAAVSVRMAAMVAAQECRDITKKHTLTGSPVGRTFDEAGFASAVEDC